VLVLFSTLARIASADAVIATVPVGNTPIAVAVNPVTNKVYVANADSSSVTIIDGTISIDQLPLPLPKRTLDSMV